MVPEHDVQIVVHFVRFGSNGLARNPVHLHVETIRIGSLDRIEQVIDPSEQPSAECAASAELVFEYS